MQRPAHCPSPTDACDSQSFDGPSRLPDRAVPQIKHFIHPGPQARQQFVAVAENLFVTVDSDVAHTVVGK
jgi:hypothetical protein